MTHRLSRKVVTVIIGFDRWQKLTSPVPLIDAGGVRCMARVDHNAKQILLDPDLPAHLRRRVYWQAVALLRQAAFESLTDRTRRRAAGLN